MKGKPANKKSQSNKLVYDNLSYCREGKVMYLPLNPIENREISGSKQVPAPGQKPVRIKGKPANNDSEKAHLPQQVTLSRGSISNEKRSPKHKMSPLAN